MNSKEEQLSKAEELFAEAFSVIREQRSLEYKRGVMAALINHFTGIKIEKNCPYKAGTVELDAFECGLEEGHRIWRAYIVRPPVSEDDRMKSNRHGLRLIAVVILMAEGS